MVKAKSSFDNEVKFSNLVRWFTEPKASRWRLNIFSWVQFNDGLVDKSSFALVKETFELCFKVSKNQVDYLGLHFWRQVLVEGKLLYYQVVIILEGFLNIKANANV